MLRSNGSDTLLVSKPYLVFAAKQLLLQRSNEEKFHEHMMVLRKMSNLVAGSVLVQISAGLSVLDALSR